MLSAKRVGQKLGNYKLLKDACIYFDTLNERDVFLWNIFIGAHAKLRKDVVCIQQFQQMQLECVLPDNITFVFMLQAYTRQQLLHKGKHLHSTIPKNSYESHVFLGSALLTMYGKQLKVDLAEIVFNDMIHKDVGLLNAMMNVYAQNQKYDDMFQLFSWMLLSEFCPDKVTFACVLGACAKMNALKEGKLVHECIMYTKLDSDCMVATALIDMYGKCASLDDAQCVFDGKPYQDVITWNVLVSGYCLNGQEQLGLQIFCQMHQEGVIPVRPTFLSIFGLLTGQAALSQLQRLHACVACSELKTDKVIATALMSAYGKCGRFEDAEQVFSGIENDSKVSWNAMISQREKNRYALNLFNLMIWEGQTPDHVTFLSMLSNCVVEENMASGIAMHFCIMHCGYESNIAVATALVRMYAKLGKLENGRKVFEKMHERNIVSWNTLIKSYAQAENDRETVHMFRRLKQEGVLPNVPTILNLLSYCATYPNIVTGKELHACIEQHRDDSGVLNALGNMYVKCGSLDNAMSVFTSMPSRDAFSWNGMLEVCAHKQDRIMAFQLLDQMRYEGVVPNKVTYISILESCISSNDLASGQEVHACVQEYDFKEDVTLISALIKMYGAGKSHTEAKKAFSHTLDRDLALWNTIISVYAQDGLSVEAFQMLDQMHQEGEIPNSVTYISLLSVCASCSFLAGGMRLHSCISFGQSHLDTSVTNALMFMYGNCGKYEMSETLFSSMFVRDRVAWTGMISMCADLGYYEEALQFYHQMMTAHGISPDKVTLIRTLSACSSSTFLTSGREVHIHLSLLGFESDVEVKNGLVSMYGKCGNLQDAWALMDMLPNVGTDSWNVKLSALLHNGHDFKVIHLFEQMLHQNISPSEVTFISILSACSNLSLLSEGRYLHLNITCSGFNSFPTVANSLIHMYAKCGEVRDACFQFNMLLDRDIVSWNALISAYAHDGSGAEAHETFQQMQAAGISPNEVSILTAMSACSHTGLVDHCLGLWMSAKDDYSPKLTLEHSDCLIDALTRSGRLDDVVQFVTNMPFQPLHVSYMSLLNACKDQVNLPLGMQIAKYLFEINHDRLAISIMLSNIYATNRVNPLEMKSLSDMPLV